MAEITFGAGRMIPTFLMVHMDDMLEYKLVQNGSICAGARESQTADTEAVNGHRPATSQENFQTLLSSIGTLIDLFGLQHVIISPAEPGSHSQACKELIKQAFPQLSVRYSDISGSSLALCAACLQFVSVQKSKPGS